MTCEEGASLVAEEMAQYFLTVDGQKGTHILDDSAAVSVFTPHVDRNRIFRARLAADTADGEIVRLLQPFQRDLVPVTWYVDACSTPDDIGARLARHGLELRYVWTGMMRDSDKPLDDWSAPASLEIVDAVTPKQRAQWMHVILEAFGLTLFRDLESLLIETGVVSGRWHRIMAMMEGTAIGGALLFTGNGVAGLHWLGVPDVYRRRGAGIRLTRECIVRAQRMGYERLVLQANPEVVELYHRLGFVTAGEIELFDWRPGIGALTVEPD